MVSETDWIIGLGVFTVLALLFVFAAAARGERIGCARKEDVVGYSAYKEKYPDRLVTKQDCEKWGYPPDWIGNVTNDDHGQDLETTHWI